MYLWHSTMCAVRISLTLGYWSVCVCVTVWAPACVLEKRTWHLCYTNDPHACVGLSQVRLMHGSCGAQRSGPRRLNRPGIISQCGPQFALSEGTASPPRGGRPPNLRCGGGVRETNPPAGGIRCYLSDWEQHHQSLLSASLCPESDQCWVIHLRQWRADKISYRACQNFATLACCVKEIVMMYLSPRATGSAHLVIKGDTAVPSVHSSSCPPGFGFYITVTSLAIAHGSAFQMSRKSNDGLVCVGPLTSYFQLKLTQLGCLPGPDKSEKAGITCS